MKIDLNHELCEAIKPYVDEVIVTDVRGNDIDMTVNFTELGEEELKTNEEDLLDLIIDTVNLMLKPI